MKSDVSAGTTLAQQHAGRFRVVSYAELRAKATAVAAQILADHGSAKHGLVMAPILMGGGLPARLVIDALRPYGIVGDVVPCRIIRYTGVGAAGEAEFALELPKTSVTGKTVIGLDDLVDGGQTLEAFMAHAKAQGAAAVQSAVIYVKPGSSVIPTYCAESGVEQWLVLPGEEHDFMHEVASSDGQVSRLSPDELADYFMGLGLPPEVVAEWRAFAKSAKTAGAGRSGVQ